MGVYIDDVVKQNLIVFFKKKKQFDYVSRFHMLFYFAIVKSFYLSKCFFYNLQTEQWPMEIENGSRSACHSKLTFFSY